MLYIPKIIFTKIDPQKKQIKEYLKQELLIMKDPLNSYSRIEGWKILLNQLIKENRIESFVISKNGLSVDIIIKDFAYYINFKDEEEIKSIIRHQTLDQL